MPTRVFQVCLKPFRVFLAVAFLLSGPLLADPSPGAARLPELPEAKRDRFIQKYDLSKYDAEGLTAAVSLKDASLANFRIAGKQSPANVSFLRTRARVTYALGSLDPSLYDQGIELMKHAMELAPTDPKIPYNLGVMLKDRGEEDAASAMFEQALQLKPDYEEAKQAHEE